MADFTAKAGLEDVLEKCAEQPLSKPNVWLLQRASVLAGLAERVYDFAKHTDANLETDFVHSCLPDVTRLQCGPGPHRHAPAHVQAKMLSGPSEGTPVHATWEVPGLGVVVAFRGTAGLQDIYADIDFEPLQLAHSAIKLHGAIYSGAARCINDIQAAYGKAAQHVKGHSLGGGYANCAFLEILATESPLSSALLRGGAYTFGSPLVAYRHTELQSTAQAIQLLFLREHQLARGWSQFPVYNFVNGLDIVPRLLGQTTIHTFAKMLALMLPQTYNNLMHKTAAVAGNFVPFGTYCLMLSDIVRVVDSTSEPQLLQITVQQLLGGAEQLGQQNQAAPYVLQRLLSDHCSSSYTAALRNALHSMVPVLFMGGHTSDYQSILVQRQSATGMVQDVALKHTSTGIVSHNAFHEVPVQKVLMGIGAAAAGGFALKEVLDSDGPKDVLTAVKAIAKGAGSFLKNDIAATKQAVGVIEAAVGRNIPSLGKVLTKSLAGTMTSSAAGSAASPLLGVANLAAGVLNLGLTGYNTYQLRGISKLQKMMDDKLSVADTKLDVITGELQIAHKVIEALGTGQAKMDDKLDWVMKSSTEITFMCDAIMQGMDRLENMLQSQAVRLDTVVQYCQALQQDQQLLIQGQDVLIQGQRVLLQEVANLHKSVVAGTDSLSMELKNMSLNNFREKADVVTGLYMDLLKHEGTQARQANLVDRACELQACTKTWLSKIAPTSAERVTLRQPFVVMSAIAAIAWDTANATTAPVSNGRVFLDSGMVNAPKRDAFSHRKEAIKQIDAEMLNLMQHSTIYSFATTFHPVMLRYVYLRRALQGRASIDEVLPMTTDALPAGGVITYDAADLMWLDGLIDIRTLFMSNVLPAAAEQVPARWKCNTLDELQWYCVRKGLPLGSHTFQELPSVYTSDLLRDLGVPEEDLKAVAAHLTSASMPVLRKAVLPSFIEEAVMLMADQLPDLQLASRMQQGQLFVG